MPKSKNNKAKRSRARQGSRAVNGWVNSQMNQFTEQQIREKHGWERMFYISFYLNLAMITGIIIAVFSR